ncbi:hypothetical protein G5B30_04750 [Sphingobacterium sp. SGG-5]|uniref:FISUMP domain-containing protein n=1 Tax=Sphingobacterium sp. SGG-5 TaxID=2710881 RepID=UPI0013EBAB72|nr:FISUMP domain-containing protein [Sphingobacterium sp. SGG-5]NGM61226.1 hypothetical protein [Sphingobacterium sp. SGG-5]
MKKHMLKLMILFLCGLTVMSCKKESDLSNADEIQLDDISLNFNNGAQSQLLEIPIKEKSNDWHIYSPSQDTWLTQEIIPGRSSIYVYVDGNTSGEARSSYIVIRSKNYTQKINVQQDSEGGINLSQTYVPVRYLNSTSTVSINNYDELTDISVSAEEGTQDWLSILTENDKINLNVKINDLTSAREALITVTAKRKISGETVTSFINLYQGRGGMTPYVIDIPDFSTSNVYKVMDGTKQVAQITKEFLRSVGLVNAQAIVIYPVENDIVALNKGYVAQIILENKDLTDATFTYQTPITAIHGGTVSFDIANNKISGYVAGTEANPVAKVYMPGDVGMGPEEVPGSKTTTVEPHLIVDVRGTERNEYPIVKIGAQYWMGKNLNTVYYNSNKSFAAIPTNIMSNTQVPNYSVYTFVNGASTDPNALLYRERYGLYYSYLTIGGFADNAQAGVSAENDVIADNISPQGWIVPSVEEALSLKAYIGTMARLRKFIDYSTGQQIYPVAGRTDDNITGFAAPNGSYRNGNTSWAGLGNPNGAWYLTRSLKDANNVKIIHMNDVLNGGSAMTRNYSIRSLNTTSIQTSDN